ncbi:helix-turn-helix domain-containing protein [Polymorphospora sp. NPDC051019]|uniref:helix-turn-helix domain-containing protein n=1 Tax=Polymorphospora sp. NPDC051019 TaxID=3155725 RepID=UPI0034229CF6
MGDVHYWSAEHVKALRAASRMTKTEFARRLGVTLRSITNWEAGRPLSPFSQSLLDGYLKAANENVVKSFHHLNSDIHGSRRLSEHAKAGTSENERRNHDGTRRSDVTDLEHIGYAPLSDNAIPHWIDHGTEDGNTGSLREKGESALLHEVASLAIDQPAHRVFGWTEVHHVRHITRALARSENVYGGGLSAAAAVAQLRSSARMLEARAGGEVRRAMYEAVGNLGCVVGFSAFDIEAHRLAKRCFDFSLWCAVKAQSWELRASTLADMARLSSYLGDNDSALSLIELAQVRSDRVSATSRAMLCSLRAKLLAWQDRYAEAMAEVDRSDGYFASRTSSEDPPWLSYYDEAEHQGSTGRALVPVALSTKDLGVAVPRLKAAVRLHDQHYPRSRAFSRTRLASLLMKAGNPKEAAEIGRAALVDASSMRSSRLNSEIRQLDTLAIRYEKVAEVAELRNEVRNLPWQESAQE